MADMYPLQWPAGWPRNLRPANTAVEATKNHWELCDIWTATEITP